MRATRAAGRSAARAARSPQQDQRRSCGSPTASPSSTPASRHATAGPTRHSAARGERHPEQVGDTRAASSSTGLKRDVRGVRRRAGAPTAAVTRPATATSRASASSAHSAKYHRVLLERPAVRHESRDRPHASPETPAGRRPRSPARTRGRRRRRAEMPELVGRRQVGVAGVPELVGAAPARPQAVAPAGRPESAREAGRPASRAATTRPGPRVARPRAAYRPTGPPTTSLAAAHDAGRAARRGERLTGAGMARRQRRARERRPARHALAATAGLHCPRDRWPPGAHRLRRVGLGVAVPVVAGPRRGLRRRRAAGRRGALELVGLRGRRRGVVVVVLVVDDWRGRRRRSSSASGSGRRRRRRAAGSPTFLAPRGRPP